MNTQLQQKRLTFADPVETAYDIVVDIPLTEFEEDPYRFYDWMRKECPIAYVPESNRVWLLTWDLCREAGVNEGVFGPTQQIHQFVYGHGNIMTLTGDKHRAVRAAANSPLRPKQTKGYQDRMLETTHHYLDAVSGRGRADAAREIFEPICMRAVGDIVGFGDLDDDTLSRWLHALSARLVDYGRDPEVDRRSQAVKVEIREYLERRLPELAQSEAYTVLGHLLHDGMPEGQVRSIEEIQPTAEVLIIGGFQEPAHLASSALYGLLTHPEQLQLVLDDPGTWVNRTIAETLRWLPPFGMTEKLTTEEITLGGVVIPAGTEIAMVIGSANRDPKRFENPNEFDITREDVDNVSFGFGSHFCIGHNVARALGGIVLTEALAALPGVRLDPDQPVVVHGWQARGPQELPILWDA